MGFADGFRTGYGLVSDVKDRELKKTQLENAQSNADRNFGAAEDERRLRSEERSADLKRQTQNEKLTAEYRQGISEYNESRLAQQKTDSDYAKDPTNPANIDRLANSKVTREYQASVTAKNKQDTLSRTESEEGIEAEVAYAGKLDSYVKYLESMQSGQIPTNEATREKLASLYPVGRQGLLDPLHAVNPQTLEDGQALGQVFNSMAQGVEVDRDPITQAIETMVRSSNARRVGTEVNVTNTPNAGSWNGRGFTIKSKKINGNWTVSNGELRATVDVTIVNDRGKEAVYQAPVTSGRLGSDGEPLPIKTQDLVDASAGFFKYSQTMSPFKDEIIESNKRLYDLQNGRGSFDILVNKSMSKFISDSQKDAYREEPSPIRGMTYGQMAQDTSALREYFTFSLLDPSRNNAGDINPADNIIDRMTKLKEVKEFEGILGRPLGRDELLQVAAFADESGTAIDKKEKGEWIKWRNNIYGRGAPESSIDTVIKQSAVQDVFLSGGMAGL